MQGYEKPWLFGKMWRTVRKEKLLQILHLKSQALETALLMH